MGHLSRRLFALSASLVLALPLGAAPQQAGPLDLGGLGGSPLAVNVVAVGKNGTLAGGAQRPDLLRVPFTWSSNSGFSVIGSTTGMALAANGLGQVVGTQDIPNVGTQGFLFTPPGTLTSLVWSQASGVTPQAINDLGQVAGVANMNTGETHVFVWSQSKGFKDLGSLSWTDLAVVGINAGGLVVGTGRQSSGGFNRAFQSRNGGKLQDLGTLGGPLAQPTGVNDAGTIVGYSRTADNNLHGFVYSNGTMTALASPTNESGANAINASGMIVGWGSNFGANQAMVWSPAGVPQVITGADICVAVNDSGVVALYGGTQNQNTRAFLWNASQGLLDGGSSDEQWSQAVGVTADGWLVALRHDWADTDKTYVWNPSTGRVLIDGIPSVWSRGLFVNASGQVAGISRTALGYNRAFLWTPNGTGGGSMVEVPAPPGWNSTPVGLNSSGAVAGTTEKTQSHISTPGPSFYWPGQGTFSDLGLTTVVDLNESGQVLGYQYPISAFVWQHSIQTTLPSIGAGQLVPNDINNLGQVVGRFNVDNSTIHAFSWVPGSAPVDLGTLGGTFTEAVAVNDLGQIAGNSNLAGDSVTHAFRTTVGKKLTDLGALWPGGQSFASKINKDGVVVGSTSMNGSVFHAFMYDKKISDLGEIFDPSVRPAAINDLKDVVGWRPVPPAFMPRGFVSLGGASIVDLPTLAGNYARAFGLNNAGVVVGDALDENNQQHGVFWRTR